MKELKKHLSLTEQVALLESRGLVIADKQAAEELLYHVNYYRLPVISMGSSRKIKHIIFPVLRWSRSNLYTTLTAN